MDAGAADSLLGPGAADSLLGPGAVDSLFGPGAADSLSGPEASETAKNLLFSGISDPPIPFLLFLFAFLFFFLLTACCLFSVLAFVACCFSS